MKISILTLFPKTLNSFFSESIIKRAIEKSAVEIEIINIRDFAKDAYGSVDDKPYGGGAGMVMRIDVIVKALEKSEVQPSLKLQPASQSQKSKVKQKIILTTPRGLPLKQHIVKEYASMDHIVIICGHYEGFDERISELIDDEISLGDFVMTGGEITAAAIVDSIVRLLPGAIKKESPEEESFSEVSVSLLKNIIGADEIIESLIEKKVETVRLLEYPQYTRPEDFNGKKVPSILLSGNHKEIERWRIKMAYEETKKRRPDLLE